MHRHIWLILVAVAMLAILPAFAGEHGKCTMSTQDCLDHMAASMKSSGWVGVELDTDNAGGYAVTKVIEKSFKSRSIDIRTDVKVEGHSPSGSGTTVQAGGESLDVDVVVVSIGRRPNTDDLGLDGTAVQVEKSEPVKLASN